MMIIVTIYATSTIFWDIRNCTLLESPFHFESNGVIFTFLHLSKHKLWPYNYVNACNFNRHRNAYKAMYCISSFHSW